MAALYTHDAVEVRSWQGMASGREAIQKRFADDFASNPGKMVERLVQVYETVGDMCAMMDTTVGPYVGNVIRIYVPYADTWKIRLTYVKF